jgi:glutamate--cysteine ligase
MGVEWELLPCLPTGFLAPYLGERGVEGAFLDLAGRGYGPHEERGAVVGLSAPSGAFLGLEPGAQVEVATPALDGLADLESELRTHYLAIQGAAHRAGWVPMPWGLAPRNGPEDLPDVPKERYLLLADHLRRKGSLGRWMMKLTAATQISLDTLGPESLGDQVDGALRLLPYLAGWLANSPVARGRKSRWKTLRPKVWCGTDRARCGLPPFLFRAADPVGEWLRYYLSREALFFVRGGQWHRGDGRAFGQWLKAPGPMGPLTADDWTLHTSTVFPDLRFRGYLELRVADSVPLETLLGASALCKGLLGDPARVRSWRDILPAPGRLSTRRNILAAARGGGEWFPEAGRDPKEAAPDLFREARRGLEALGDDGGYLEPLERSARQGRCPADTWTRHRMRGWSGPDALGKGAPEGSP